MKTLLPILSLIGLLACQEMPSQKVISNSPTLIQSDTLDLLIKKSNLEGSVLIFDTQKNQYISNNHNWTLKKHLPASTFKIPNSIIGLEIGIISDKNYVFEWDGEEKMFEAWEQDLTLKKAFQYSCVPCYRGLARKIGLSKMKTYVQKLNFGTMVFDAATLDLFWLEGKSRISQLEQIDFLQRFYNRKLPIQKNTFDVMKKVMLMEENNSYKLSGKTGWSIQNGNNNGWFVGYLETENNLYFFATNIEPNNDFDMKYFPKSRKEITLKSFQKLGFISTSE